MKMEKGEPKHGKEPCKQWKKTEHFDLRARNASHEYIRQADRSTWSRHVGV